MARERIPLGLSFGVGRSPATGLQSHVNFYSEEVQAERRTNVVLHGTPGTALFSTIGGGTPRGQIRASDANYAVVGTRLYSVASDGTDADLGEIEGTLPVDMSFNGNQIAIVGDLKSYEYDVLTSSLAEIADPNFDQASSTDSVSSYSIFGVKGTGRFRWKLTNSTSFGANDVATAEAESDALTFVRRVGDEIALGGKTSLEFWRATGLPGADAFAKVQVAASSIGSDSRDTALVVDGGLTFVGRDGKAGGASVYRAKGYQPLNISNPQIDKKLEAVSDLSTLRAFSYQQNNHLFYVLTYPGEWTYAWDVSRNIWAPRKTGSWSMGSEPTGGLDAYTFALNGSKQIVGASDGNLYQLLTDTLTENALPIVREATTPVLWYEGKQKRMKNLELDVETGVALGTGQGSQPVIHMSMSDDNGHTWSSPRAASMGLIGQYKVRCRWPGPLGVFRNRIIKFRGSDPIPLTFLAAYADIS